MVSITEKFRRRWERERKVRELAELEELAECLVTLFGGTAPQPRSHANRAD